MSADNGVYIVKFPDGYRVAYAMAIENIDFYPEGTHKRKQTLARYFGESKVYPTKQEAILAAHEEADQCSFLEYGVQYIGEYESFLEDINDNVTSSGPGDKDVHTEHCCKYCGCKYGDYGDCTVGSNQKKQSYPCGENEICK